MSEILLLRHGQASFGEEDYDRLSDIGRKQVTLLGEHLAGVGLEVDQIFSGAMRRQRESASGLLAGMGGTGAQAITIMQQFNEFDHLPVLREHLRAVTESGGETPDMSRLPKDRNYFQNVFADATAAWIAGDLQASDLESWVDFCARVEDGMHTLQDRVGDGGRVLISTSAGAISVALQCVLGTPREEALRLAWVIRNSSLTRILWDGERASLEMFNSVAHLERKDRIDLITYR